jgi:hypothetical protein
MRGISWLAENRLASQEGILSMEYVSKMIVSGQNLQSPRFSWTDLVRRNLVRLKGSFFYRSSKRGSTVAYNARVRRWVPRLLAVLRSATEDPLRTFVLLIDSAVHCLSFCSWWPMIQSTEPYRSVAGNWQAQPVVIPYPIRLTRTCLCLTRHIIHDTNILTLS